MKRQMALIFLVLCWIPFCLCAMSEDAPAPDAPEEALELYSPVQPGETGKKVLLMQCRLIELGYYHDIAEGTFGVITQDALMDFQAVNGFESDGKASEAVLRSLFGEGAIDASGNAHAAFEIPALILAQPDEASEIQYIGNRNTHKFHMPGCESVSDMRDSNRTPLYSREEALVRGFVPCKRCNP